MADALVRSHALSGDVARSLRWQPSRGSIMKDVEQSVSESVIVSRLRLPHAECSGTFQQLSCATDAYFEKFGTA